ncbi:MAG: XrtA-associated ATPase [Amphiplicatus sp.]
MYEEYFSFAGSPFRLNPDPKFFFGSKSHNKAMAYLHYGLRQAVGFIVITGEIGAGKSMLIWHLLDQLDRTNVVAANLVTSNLEPSALLSHVLSAFRIEAANKGKSAEIEAFEDFLFDQMNRGRRVLLIVDEAQNLPARTIEELRMLSNMDYDGTPLFQVFLIGQPEFRGILAKPDMEQFRQRVIATYHLEPLSTDETREYIEHRLSVVGWSGDPSLAEDAHLAIFEATGGVPRKINSLCNRIFLYCSLEKLRAIDAKVVGAVVADLSQEKFTSEAEGVLPEEVSAPENSRKRQKAKEKPKAEAEEDVAEETEQERATGGGRGSVVVPFGAVKKAPPAEAEPAPKTPPAENAAAKMATATTKTAPAPSTEDLSQMSVLDRLRAQRAAQKDVAPASATLKDVAEAIAAASSFTNGEGGSAAFDDVNDDEETPAGDAKGWPAVLTKSINETRDELKTAHAGAQRVRQKLWQAAAQRAEKRKHIAESLARAEALLSELREPGN